MDHNHTRNGSRLIHLPSSYALTPKEQQQIIAADWWYIVLDNKPTYITMRLDDFPRQPIEASGCLISWSEYEHVTIEPVADEHKLYPERYSFGT